MTNNKKILLDDEIVNGATENQTDETNKDFLTSSIHINPSISKGGFFSKLVGVCLVPFPQGGNHAFGVSKEGTKRCAHFLKNGAVKLWYEPVSGGRPDMLLKRFNRDVMPDDIFSTKIERKKLWEEFEDMLKTVYPCDAYVLINHMPPAYKERKEKAVYKSEIDNNLDEYSTPESRGQQAALLLRRWREVTADNNAVIKINLWNEPQFDTTGNWEPEDFARFVLDCAKRMTELAPGAVPVVPLHMSNNSWNERLLAKLIGANIEICDHNYGFSWINISKEYPELGTYLSRMADHVRCAEKLQKDKKLIEKYGKGSWEFSILEWNLHPEGYLGSFRAANDLASVFHQFNFIKSMSDINVDAATFFQFQGFTHFAMAVDENLRIQNPPFRLFDWLGRYACGSQIVDVNVCSPNYTAPRWPFKDEMVPPYEYKGELTVPYISSMAFRKDNVLNLFIQNLHPEKEIEVCVELATTKEFSDKCEVKTMTAEFPTPMPESIREAVFESVVEIKKGRIIFNAPRHSLSILSIVESLS